MRQFALTLAAMAISIATSAQDAVSVKTSYGILEGLDISGIKTFKGVPFAAPPTGDNRWREPQPLQPWQGIRECHDYAPDPMQEPIFGDMNFGADSISEDCLYLNIWTPAITMNEKLPVLIYFNGGGLMAGSGSEPRYAGMAMARRGMICVTANYREGIFGFFAHPELSKETAYKGSGNYGFLDQQAAIRWVHENISLFGGDPERITIAGESAGSMSVSALMASPLSRGLFAQAIGSSGSVIADKRVKSLAEAEKAGVDMMRRMGYKSVKEMRKVPAKVLMKQANVRNVPVYNIDNHFLTEQPLVTYAAGRQMRVPLLVGGNSLEMSPAAYFGYITMSGREITMEDIAKTASGMFGDNTDEMLSLYGITAPDDIYKQPGIDLCGDLFLAYSTWRWGNIHNATSGQPVYRYLYSRERPKMMIEGKVAGLAGGVKDKTEAEEVVENKIPEIHGAVHSADIEYAMGNLPTNRVYDWQPEDYMVSDIFMGYYANFVKTGNPNGIGLSQWLPLDNSDSPGFMVIDVKTRMEKDAGAERRYRRMNEIFTPCR
ncbi:MAG: carboxylesterase family protein [Bacteroidales bacterium]|nr:carboxylesterase family protein [Bacteroidales bacterium]